MSQLPKNTLRLAGTELARTGELAPVIPSGWMPLAAAAGALGIGDRAARTRCQRGQLTALQVDGAWYVDPQSHPAMMIARGETAPGPALAGTGLAGLSQEQRQRAFNRMKAVQAFLEALESDKPVTMGDRQFEVRWCEAWNASRLAGGAKGVRVSTVTLYRWRKSYEQSGIEGLVDRRGGARTPCLFDAEAKDFILGTLCRPNPPSMPYVYRLALGYAREKNLRIPALRTVQAWLRKRVDPKTLLAHQDPDKFRNRALPYIRRDWERVPAMCCWVADHRQVDVMVPRRIWDEKKRKEVVKCYRPWVTMFLDTRSWMPVGWVIDWESPNADRVMAALGKAIEMYGSPEHLILDNGKDFRARDFSGGRSWHKEYETQGGRLRKIGKRETLISKEEAGSMLSGLGVVVHWAEPYNARAKIIENWFRIMSEQFDKAWPTYCGRRADLRSEAVKELLGDDEKIAALEKVFNLPVVNAAFERWINEDYAMAASPAEAARGLSPARALLELQDPTRKPLRHSTAAIMLLQSRSKRVCVSQNGVYVSAFGNHYWADELENRRGASQNDIARHVTYRYRPGEPAYVAVFDTSDRFLCIATPYVGSGVHPLATMGSDADREQLEDGIVHQHRLARDIKGVLSPSAKFASNVMLALHQRSGESAGILDNPAALARQLASRAPAALKLIGSGEIDRAGQAAEAHRSETRRRGLAAKQFFSNLDQATGTDDARPKAKRLLVNDLLTDGTDAATPPGGDAHESPVP